MPKTTPASRRARDATPKVPKTQAKPAPARPSVADAKPAMMTFPAAVRWLEERVNVERVRPSRVSPDAFKLDRMRALLEHLGNPQDSLRCVHVAGSKGKGSVCEMLSSVLGACGYTVGLFTSPHLVDVRERVRVGGEPITGYSFGQAMTRVQQAAGELAARHGEPTYFELLTALALTHFASKAVDVCVIEVGLGGRLDSTNVITPDVSAITSIQLEHTELLGDTIEEIAREKAGIMKPGVTTLTVPQSPEVMEVFRETAEQTGANLAVLGEDVDFAWRFVAAHDRGPHARVSVSTARSNYEHLPVPLLGEHQAPNCGLVLAIVDRLRERGFEAPEREVAAGLEATPTNGRLEQILDTPRIVIDGAHTPESVAALVKSIGAHVRYDSMVVIFGCAADKNVEAMLAEVARGADKVIFTRAEDSPRAADPEALERMFAETQHKMSQHEATLKDAINTAARAVGRGDLICVTGSFYLAGEAKKLVRKMLDKRAAGGAS